ncbi:ATP-binding cassette domain-containing protein [Gordonia amicalis]|nr:ATP-binding cassette domain-containing protein [Gordonia amicalis]
MATDASRWFRATNGEDQGPGASIDSASRGVAASPEDGTIAIAARNLHKRFKDMVAVEDVSFTVPAGSIVALLGPNGAGKTTTVNMLCTLLKPDRGTATVNGFDVRSDAASVRKSIMLTGQFAALDEALSGRENLILFGRLLGLDKPAARARADELLDVFSLTDVASKRVREYSGGMRRRIDIACGLVTAPKIVFLDEPTTGLDPRSRQEVWALVEKLRDSGVTILLTTQYLEEADVLSDNIVVIDKGRVIAEGTSDELKASTGPAYCELTPADPADLARLRTSLADLIGEDLQDEDDHFVAVPAPDGPETLVEVIRRTAAADISLSDVAMRRPSLDEVFLALTDPRRDRKTEQA